MANVILRGEHRLKLFGKKLKKVTGRRRKVISNDHQDFYFSHRLIFYLHG